MADELSVLGGLYDLNSEFYVIESSGSFINPAFGISSDISQIGKNAPSIFPTTSVGLRVRGQNTDQTYAQVVVLDTVPGNPDHPKGTHMPLSGK